MNGWTNRSMDTWVDGWTNGWRDRWMDISLKYYLVCYT